MDAKCIPLLEEIKTVYPNLIIKQADALKVNLSELVTNEKVTIAKLNVDEAKMTASKFKVRSIPTLILFKNGKEVHRFVGVKSKDYLLKELDRRTTFN